MVEIIRNLDDWRQLRTDLKGQVGFVPTMGALHQGHRSLLKRSRAENDISVMSIFVNPAQFNDPKDLEKYPASLDEDQAMAEDEGVDHILLPRAKEIYGDDYSYRISEDKVSKTMEGKHRPGHFDGVLTVLMKLFQLVKPTRSYFGEKDYQQYLLVKGMVESFFLDLEIVPCPTLREDSGLAMSSRNRLLSEQAKVQAASLYQTLATTRNLESGKQELEAAGFGVEYLEEAYGRRFVAAQLDGVRLIDNVSLPPSSTESPR